MFTSVKDESSAANVLLVEDSAVDARLVRGLLERSQGEAFVVVQVAALADALHALDRSSFSIVILDLGLPDSRGLETLERLRARAAEVPIVVLTGTDDEMVGMRAIHLGAQDYIPKNQLQPHLLARSIRYARERHRAALAVRESHELVSRTIASAVDAIITKTTDGIITSWNPGAERLFGYPPDEAIGKPILILIPPDRTNEKEEILARVKQGEKVEHFETIRIRKDGREVQVSVTISPIRDSQGNIVGASEIARDITERKRAEKSLRESERQLRQFIEEAPVAVAMFDRDMRYLAASRLWVEYYGQGRQLVGLSHYELHPDIPERWKELHRRGLAGAVLRNDQDRWLRNDGSEEWLRWAIHPWHEPSGDVGGIIISAEDITERKQAEDTLRRQASLIDQAYDAVFVWERSNVITFWNRGAANIFGFSEVEAIGRNPHELLKTSEGALKEAMKSLHEKGSWEGELEHTRSDGKRLVVESRMVQISEGERSYVLETNRDMTEKRLLEEQLRQSQKMEAVGQLAGGVAHDFNNLLGVILGSAELLAEETNSGRIRKGLEDIRKAGQRAANLTRQLLAFSRRQILEPKILDPNATLAELVEMLRRLVGENIEILMSFSADVGSIRVDPSQLEQILLNLVVNARDAMPRGGKITIETANVEFDEAYARSHASAVPGRCVMIAVSDCGSGMDSATQARIFEPFFTTKKSGTGLGLATVYGAVKQSEGNIWVYSEPGQGTTFKVYFPRVAESPNRTAREESDRTMATGAGTVLLVEDSDSLLMVTREFLQIAGYKVLAARGGEEALRLARSHQSPIHLLLTDVVMPEMSGRDLAKELKRVHPETVVLFMSGYTPDAIVHHGVLDEGISLLPKPFSRVDLARKIAEMLSRGAESAVERKELNRGPQR